MKHPRKKLCFSLIIMALLQINVCFSQHQSSINISAEAAGYVSSMRFSIAGNLQGNSPNILSELTWSNLQYFGGGIKASYRIAHRWQMYTGLMYGSAIKGDVSDIDYVDDNRKGITSELYHSSHNSRLLTANAGWAFTVWQNNNWAIKAGLDYTFQKQKLYILNYPGSNYSNDESYAEGLYSYYSTAWNQYGISTSAAFRKLKNTDIEVTGIAAYCHQQAYGNWNLKQQYQHPKSFTHNSKGIAIQNRLTARFNKTKRVRPYLAYGFVFLHTKNGIDKLYLQTGRIAYTKLNETRAANHSLAAGIQIGL
ncbi:MAG: hypothetical protein ACTHLE_15750 [Agriterribacter sp.]